jgi:protein-disulfide isomerase
MNRKLVFVASTIVLLVAFAGGALLYQSEKVQRWGKVIGQNQTALASAHSPTIGNADAKVHVVEFLDPACETCAQFYPEVKKLMAANPDKIRLSIRHVAFHNGSEYVVRLLEASRKQDKYWQTLEALLASQGEWAPNHTVQPELVNRAVRPVGLNFEQLAADMKTPEVAQRIEQDRKDAKALDVTKTPEYFVNGRPLPSFGLQQLQTLVRDALRNAN